MILPPRLNKSTDINWRPQRLIRNEHRIRLRHLPTATPLSIYTIIAKILINEVEKRKEKHTLAP